MYQIRLPRHSHYLNIQGRHIALKYQLVNYLIMFNSSASNSSALDIDWRVEKADIACLEHVVVQVTLDLVLADSTPQYDYNDYYNALEESLMHSYVRRGDISIVVTSPSNTQSTILPYRDRDFINARGYQQWPFLSVHFWGEDPRGTWNIRVSSRSAATAAVVRDVRVMLYGTEEVPYSVSQIPPMCSPSCHPGKGCSSKCCDACRAYRDAVTLECLTSCPNGTQSAHNYCIKTNESISYEYESTALSSAQVTPSTVRVASSSATSASTLGGGVTSSSGYLYTISTRPQPTGNAFLNIDKEKGKGRAISGSVWQCCSHLAITLLCFSIVLSLVL